MNPAATATGTSESAGGPAHSTTPAPNGGLEESAGLWSAPALRRFGERAAPPGRHAKFLCDHSSQPVTTVIVKRRNLLRLSFALLVFTAVHLFGADYSVRYSQSAQQAVIVSYFDRHAEGNGLIGTVQIANISDTWVYLEQDLTFAPGSTPVVLPYPVYLLGPGMVKTLPDIRFPAGSYLQFTATTPLGLDFTSLDPRVPTLFGALAVDLMSRGLLTFALPPDAFDHAPADLVRGVVDPVLHEILTSASSATALGSAIHQRNLRDILAALVEIAAEEEVKALLAELFKRYASDVEVDQAIQRLNFLSLVLEVLDLREKLLLLTDLTERTFAAPPTSWARLDLVARPDANLPAPSSLAATAVSSSQINLTWRDNSNNETGFRLQRRTAGGEFADIPNAVAANGEAFANTAGLAAGTTYFYRIRAFNGAANSDWSAEASATTFAPPAATYTLTITSSNPSSGVAFWTVVGNGGYLAGTTPTPRSFANGATVWLTCFGTLPGGMVFQKWQLDGSDYASSTDITVTMNGPHTLTAVYDSAPPPPRVLSNLTIMGPSAVDERSSTQYQARANYTDGTFAYVNADWDDDTGYADISGSGLLDTDAVSGDREIEIEATFTAGGVTKSDTKTVTIRNTDAVPTYTLTLTTEGSGSISRSLRGTSYAEGTEVNLRANPQTGWRFSHWTGDASGEENVTTVRMSRDRSVTAHFIVDTRVGGIRTFIQPPEAVAAGATWGILARTSGKASGETVAGLNVRDYHVNFATIPGFVAPENARVTVEGGVTQEITGTYLEIPGTVQVVIEPAAASAAGARWRLDGGEWLESGVNVLNVGSGGHRIEFKEVPGWGTPAPQEITVARAAPTLASGQYSAPAGLPLVTAISPKTGPLAGGTAVTIEGANFQAGTTVSFGGVAAASVTVVSSSRITAITPPRASYGSVALSVTSGGQTVTQANGFSYLNVSGANIELVGQIGGDVQAVAVVGNTVYYGEGPGLVVADFANPGAPVERGRIALPAVVAGVVVVNNIAFAAVGGAGLYAVDVSVPTAPAIVGFFDTDGAASGVAVFDGTAYVANEYTLQIFDVTNPAAIVRLGEFDTAGPARRVVAGRIGSKRYAFVAESFRSDSALRAIDVTAPNAAVEVATVPADGNAGIIDVKLVGTTLFASDREGRVKIFDASNPANLVLIGSRGGVGGSFIDVVGNRLYACIGGLKIVDLSVTPDLPILGGFGIGSSCYDLVVANDLAFVAMGRDGLKVVDVSNPASMSLRSAIQTLGGVEDVWVSEGVAFVGNGSGLHTVDVSNPAHPVRLATLPGDRVTDIVVADGKATLVNYGDEEVRVVNVANPSAPSLLDTYTGVEAWNIALMGSTPVLAAATRDDAHLPILDVLDLSSPSSPQSSGSLLLDSETGIAGAVSIVGNWAFIARPAWASRPAGALDVVSLANPASLQRIGSVVIPDCRLEVAASEDGNVVYVPVNAGIQIVDVTARATPVLGQLIDPPQTSGNVSSVQAVGNRLFADEGGFIFAFNISEPATPQMIGYYDIPGGANGIHVAGNLIFVAGNNAGLSVLRLMDVDKPTIAITSPTANTAHSTSTALLTLGGAASDDKGVTRVSWVNDRGGGGIATGTTSWQIPGIQLVAGVNVITVTAEDANGNLATDSLTVTVSLPDNTAPVVIITGPKPDAEFAVSTETITLSGSAADNQSVASVVWSSGAGGSGPATLTGQTWTVANVPLVPGPNVIQVTATDANGNSASDTAVIFLVPPDTAPPVVTIDFPTANAALETQTSELNLSGLATDDQGVARVEWSDGRGGQGVASGAFPWSVNGIALQPGLNVIEITAFDAAGNAESDSLAVTYVPPPLELEVLGVVDGVFRFQVSGPAGSTIAIQRSGDFNQWEPLGTRTLPPEGTTTVEDEVSLDGQRFYRVLPQGQ